MSFRIEWTPYQALSVTGPEISMERRLVDPIQWRLADDKRPGNATLLQTDDLRMQLRTLKPRSLNQLEYILDIETKKTELRTRPSGGDESLSNGENGLIHGITVTPANHCDRGCAYCYARPSFDTRNPSTTGFTVLRQIFEFIRCSPAVSKSCAITVGGAADTLQHMDFYLEAIRLSTEYYETHGIRVPIYVPTVEPTSLTDHNIRTIFQHQEWITVSLDGDPGTTYHRRRVDIRSTLKEYGEAGRWAASGVFSRKTAQLIRGSYAYLLETGFDAVHMRPVRLPRSHPLALDGESYAIALNEYDALLNTLKKSPDTLVDFFSHISSADCIGQFLDRLLLEIPVKERCGAGLATAYVNANGQIMPCPSITAPLATLGNVGTGLFFRNTAKELHRHPEECQRCHILTACGGPCIHESLLYSGDIIRADADICNFQRGLYDLCVSLIRYLLENDPLTIIELLEGFVEKSLGIGDE